MRTEAASAGFYKSPGATSPNLQIVTWRIVSGKKFDTPRSRQTSVTFKDAPQAPTKGAQAPLDFSCGR
jgi:hypothetical protein